MPFIALREGTRVLPHEASTGEPISCPRCNRLFTVVDSHRRAGSFIARHFRHQTDVDCNGESDDHRRMKLIAFSKLQTEYSHATIELEASVEDRRADVLVSFSDPRQPVGHGIAVEVQHRNNSKNLLATDQDYYDAGFSVLWLSEQHYSGYNVDLGSIQPVWPCALPRLRGYDGLSWPVDAIETRPSVELTIPFPDEILTEYEQELRTAFERGQEQQAVLTGEQSGQPVHNQQSSPETTIDSTSWEPLQHIWLSRRRHPTNRAIQYVEAPSGAKFLKLSKGEQGERAEFVTVPITAENVSRLADVHELLDTTTQHRPTEGEWEDIGTCWLTPREQPVTVWLRLVSTPWEAYAFQLGKKNPQTGTKQEVTASFSLADCCLSDLHTFFTTIRKSW